MNVNKVLTRDYENKSNWALFENKANTKPIQTQTKPTCSELACPDRSRRGRTYFRGKKMLLRMIFNGRRNYNDRGLAEKAGHRINSISTAGLLYFPGKSL
jgi:hypothetical protein